MLASLEAKRALDTTFTTHTEQMRFAVGQAPGPRILFAASLPERPVYTYGVLSILLGFAVGMIGSTMVVVSHAVTRQKINTGQDMIAATERVADVLATIKDGASAVYGSDAIAGVINFILRKDFQGTEVNANYFSTEHGGGNDPGERTAAEEFFAERR